jgi:hypothetical protein
MAARADAFRLFQSQTAASPSIVRPAEQQQQQQGQYLPNLTPAAAPLYGQVPVHEDTSSALFHQSQSILTPSSSYQSRNSSATPVRAGVSAPDQSADSQPSTQEDFTRFAPLPLLGDQTTDEYMSGPWPNDLGMDLGWLDAFDER